MAERVTYVVYDLDLSDFDAALLISEAKGFPLLQTDENKDAGLYDAIYDENNLVCIGGWHANAYTRHYFYEAGLVEDDPEKEIMIGEGVYADGKRYRRTITRENGTTVTAIFGWSAEDTLAAAEDYLAVKKCFIATAAYGSTLDSHLFTFRKFRDTCLPPQVTSLYYRLSPPLAQLVAQHQRLRFLTRQWLNIIAKMLRRKV